MKGRGKAVLYSPANEVEILSAVERCVYLMRQKENQEDEVVGKPGKGNGSQKDGAAGSCC